PWPKAKSRGTAARTNATRKLAGRRKKRCTTIGGDNSIMQISIEAKPYATLETDALVSYVFEESDLVQGRIAELDQSANGLLKKLASSGELTGKSLEMT